MLCILVAMLLLIALNGCAIVVQDRKGVCHHAGIGVGTSPSFCIRIGYWYNIPIDEDTCIIDFSLIINTSVKIENFQ